MGKSTNGASSIPTDMKVDYAEGMKQVRDKLVEVLDQYLARKLSPAYQVIVPELFTHPETKAKFNLVFTLEVVPTEDGVALN